MLPFLLILFQLSFPVMAQEGSREKTCLPVTITSDRMEGNFKEGVITFLDHVKVVRGEMVLHADRVDTYPKNGGEDVERIVARGHVRVIQGSQTSVADQVEYLKQGELLILTGHARVSDGKNTVFGPLIRVYLDENRAEVEGNTVERPKFLFYPEERKSTPGEEN